MFKVFARLSYISVFLGLGSFGFATFHAALRAQIKVFLFVCGADCGRGFLA
jgi:hypothetical protein